MQVLNPCVRSFFEDSKGEQDMFNASYQGQLFSLSNLEHSTPMAAIDALKQTLAPKSTHWSILKGICGVWAAMIRLKIQTLVLRLLVQVWYRLVHYYMMWPWPVAKMVDRRVDAEDQALLAEELLHANDCCLDEGLGAVLQSAMDSAESLVNQPFHPDFLSQLMNSTQSPTILGSS